MRLSCNKHSFHPKSFNSEDMFLGCAVSKTILNHSIVLSMLVEFSEQYVCIALLMKRAIVIEHVWLLRAINSKKNKTNNRSRLS